MSDVADVALVDQTEDWFVRNGIPHFIDDFSASEDVWTRAVGMLTFVFFCEMFLTFGPGVEGWQQFGVFVLGLVIVAAAVAFVNRLRGRTWFERPRDIGAGELALFVLVPPVLAVLGNHRTWGEFLFVVGFNIGVLILTYLVVSWGLFSMVRWGLVAMWAHMTQVLQLLGRILPLMLLFSAFLFLNAEIWQVVNDFPPRLFALVMVGLALLGLIFLVGAMVGSIRELRWFDTWAEVGSELDGTPLDDLDVTEFDGRPKQVPLGRAARANLTLRLVVGLAAQVLAVTFLIFGFYVGFGMLTVRRETVLQWTTLTVDELPDAQIAAFDLFGEAILLTRLHLVAAGFVAAFSGLQFAVSLVTDESYRTEFVEDSNAEVREALAVRAAYLRLRRDLVDTVA